MKFKCVISLSAAALVAQAHAQNLAISVKFSTDGGASWSSNVFGIPGSIVQVGLFMSGDNVYGLGGATFRLTATGAIPLETAIFAAGTDTGRVGPFNFGSATNAIYATGNGFRIDAASDPDNTNTAAGMTFFQRDPSSGGAVFSTANPALCFRFDIHTRAGPEHAIQIAIDQVSRGVATYYSSSSATRPTSASVTLNSGILNLLPTPSTLALVLLGPLVASRRRRS